MPTGDKEKDKKLPGMGGVFNSKNIALYSYAGANPIIYLDPDGNELIIVGDGGHAGQMFLLAAKTWVKENPGDHQIVQVNSGAETIAAMEAYAKKNGGIDGIEVFAHSGPQALYVDSSSTDPNSLYSEVGRGMTGVGDKARYVGDIKKSWFKQGATTNLHGCNTAAPVSGGGKPIAQEIANQTGTPTTGAKGPSVFSGVNGGKPGEGLPSTIPNNYKGSVYLVPQYKNKGFETKSPE